MRRVDLALACGLGVALLAAAPLARAQENMQETIALDIAGDDEVGDHHEGYYYPTPQTVEHYVSRVVTLPDSDEIRRQGFVIGMARQLVSGQYAPDYAIFAKGNEAQKLIIIGLRDGSLDTLYRARALFASMTLIARSTPFFQKNTQPEEATFFDLLKLLGFTQVTISDGKQFCHQVIID
ncbi:molybdopterin-guanine dinucleotide biosynthesis protein A [Dongia mobilis]|jgi:hypothetical protein|uniref:molybdopterin-guanine dinucleotide biosynthesis protein A n=1 Tax=Dongia sp. TaxID=1977262 RepID=UPI0026E9AF20